MMVCSSIISIPKGKETKWVYDKRPWGAFIEGVSTFISPRTADVWKLYIICAFNTCSSDCSLLLTEGSTYTHHMLQWSNQSLYSKRRIFFQWQITRSLARLRQRLQNPSLFPICIWANNIQSSIFVGFVKSYRIFLARKKWPFNNF